MSLNGNPTLDQFVATRVKKQYDALTERLGDALELIVDEQYSAGIGILVETVSFCGELHAQGRGVLAEEYLYRLREKELHTEIFGAFGTLLKTICEPDVPARELVNIMHAAGIAWIQLVKIFPELTQKPDFAQMNTDILTILRLTDATLDEYSAKVLRNWEQDVLDEQRKQLAIWTQRLYLVEPTRKVLTGILRYFGTLDEDLYSLYKHNSAPAARLMNAVYEHAGNTVNEQAIYAEIFYFMTSVFKFNRFAKYQEVVNKWLTKLPEA